MTALTIRLPNSLHESIKLLARKDGISVNQFIASAAAEKLASFQTLDYRRRPGMKLFPPQATDCIRPSPFFPVIGACLTARARQIAEQTGTELIVRTPPMHPAVPFEKPALEQT